MLTKIAKVFFVVALLGMLLLSSSTSFAFEPRSSTQRKLRLQHAKELLGSRYHRSVVRQGEKIKKINRLIYTWTREKLPKTQKSQYRKIAQAIIDESLKHEFDPVLVMSVIEGESSFDPSRRGALDEIGLMQIRPGTAEWLAKQMNLKWTGEKMLLDPVTNIKIGTYYLGTLRDQFDSHARLYLAAYNMGPGNVESALDRKVWPQDYPKHVMRYYLEYYASI